MLVMAVIMCVHCAESNVASSSKTENNMTKRIDDMVENLFLADTTKIDNPREHFTKFFVELFKINEDNKHEYSENEKENIIEIYKIHYDLAYDAIEKPEVPSPKIIALIAILYTLYSTGDYDLAKNVLNMVIKDNGAAKKDKTLILKNYLKIYTVDKKNKKKRVDGKKNKKKCANDDKNKKECANDEKTDEVKFKHYTKKVYKTLKDHTPFKQKIKKIKRHN